MAHMLNIQGLEEEENLLHSFFPSFKLAGRGGLSFLHKFPFPGRDAGSFFVPVLSVCTCCGGGHRGWDSRLVSLCCSGTKRGALENHE